MTTEAEGAQVAHPDSPEGQRLAVLEAAERLYATGRRDTPTGTIVARLDPQVDRALWLALRRTGIGSSDMAAVLGMSKYRSELDVYLDKRGETPLDDDQSSEAAHWGNLLEHIVATEWADRHGVKVRRVGTVAHVEHRHMLCDLDRYVIGCSDHERCALEVKTRSAFKADEWRVDGIPTVPEDVEAQTMQQLAVTGLDAIHVAALIGGQRLESRLVAPDPDYIADLFTVGDQFWTQNVIAGVPPEISSLDLLVGMLTRLTPEKGVVADLDDVQQRQVMHLSRIIAEGVRAAVRKDQAEAELKAIIGEDATDVVIDREPWWTWRSQNKPRKLDVEAVEAALGEPLDNYRRPNGTTRVLRKGAAVKRLIEDDLAEPTTQT